MEINILEKLETIIKARRDNPEEGSYTCYLFEKGRDKILKKVGEETAELIIAAKNGEREPIVMEAADLFYHVAVLLAEAGVPVEDVTAELSKRAEKMGNLKKMRDTDKNT